MFVFFKDRCDVVRNKTQVGLNFVFSAVTSPLYVIAMSMQMSVIPNITIYGDVKPHEINKGLLSEKIGLGKIVNRKAIATSEKQVVEYKGTAGEVAKRPPARADLI